MPSDLSPLQLVCLGPPTALVDGHAAPPEVLWRKHLALLVYLALSPSRRRTRDHLLGVLWAEQPESSARHALNQAVLRLRRALGEDRLRSETDALALNDVHLDVDALRFASGAERAPDDALALLRGDFLEGFHVEDAPEFDSWMTRERERYRALAAAALVAAGERRLTLGRFAEAGDAARRALALASRSEPAARLQMMAAALAGDAATALAAYQEFAARLEQDVGEPPGRALTALAERIRTQTWRPAGAGQAAATLPPLVGRERVHRDAFEAVAQGLARGPRALVITGPPGMGRTRLLTECARRLVLEGAVVVQARPVESDQDAPWSALRLLLRAGLAAAPGLPAARREALGALAGLAPELAERFPPREVRDVADMATALADVLTAVAEERPIALALDDAHWADGASLAALGSAVASLNAIPVVLLLAVVQGVSDPPRELLRLESDVGRAVPGVTVRLGALSQEDLGPLVAALAPWCRDDAERDRLTRRVAFETGGNPFFAVTLLGALAKATALQADLAAWPPPRGTLDTPLPFSVPSLVQQAIALQVGELGSDELAVLRAASVCGQALDLERIAHVAERSLAGVERALPAFERRQLVTFDGRRYTFAAPLVAEVVRVECITRGERRRLERRASEALASRGDLESRALRAELLARTAPGAEAFQLAIAVAREALEAGAMRIARRAAAAAECDTRGAQLDRTTLDELRARL
jgi:DNA-binding SARP family transcriptional activator